MQEANRIDAFLVGLGFGVDGTVIAILTIVKLYG